MIQVSHGDDLNLDPPISSKAEKIVKETFNFKNILDYDISLVFVSDEYLSSLKQKYFKVNQYTDVIAFRLNAYDTPFVEGEVYISLPRAKENARIFDEPYSREVSRLIIHGCLHLIGLKDKTQIEKENMTNNEDTILKVIDWAGLFKDQ
ncbi:MAG: rRNA maturation RNase YbeY [Candidatus Neomarinimicrobiota bacterium]